MGQQQLLLVVLGIIVVGIAIVVGVSVFKANAVENKRNNIINDCINIGNLAQHYYTRPRAMGGGGNSFNNFKIPNSLVNNANGSYRIKANDGMAIIINGVGNEVVTGTDSVEVDVTFTINSMVTEIIH